MAPVTISARIRPDTAERLKDHASFEDRSVSDIVNRALEEYLRCDQFPGIHFVTGGSGRRKAKLLGGPDVWSVVFTAKNHEMDARRTAEYLAIPDNKVRLALAYYAAYPDEADARLRRMAEADNDPSSIHPSIQVFTIEGAADEAAA